MCRSSSSKPDSAVTSIFLTVSFLFLNFDAASCLLRPSQPEAMASANLGLGPLTFFPNLRRFFGAQVAHDPFGWNRKNPPNTDCSLQNMTGCYETWTPGVKAPDRRSVQQRRLPPVTDRFPPKRSIFTEPAQKPNFATI